MTTIPRPLPATFGVAMLALALGLSACGGGTPSNPPGSQAPGSQAPGATLPAGTTGPAASVAVGANLEALGTELLVPIFGDSIPTPSCSDMSGGGRQCRWIVGDGELLLDADADPSFATEEDWRDAFGTAGFDEEISGVGVAALGGNNPLADGWRATAYTSDALAYVVTVNKPGDQDAVKAIVIAILIALTGSAGS